LILAPLIYLPVSAEENSCFAVESRLPVFLKLIGQSSLDANTLLQTTYYACVELMDIKTSKPGAEREHAERANSWDVPFVGPLSVNIIEVLSGQTFIKLNDVLAEYAQKLWAIKAITNRYERIKQVYLLVNQYQGKYEHNANFSLILANPKDTLERSARTSYGGICRQFAELLHWSLDQVAEPFNYTKDDTYYTKIVTSWNHMWVRVYLPTVHDGKNYVDTIDLDNTDHPDSYVPLRSRIRIVEAKRKQIYEQCQRIQTCLAN
jgi:hypothetical protein